jgi:DNA-directed RNA polymerase specialized sigma24 family protein
MARDLPEFMNQHDPASRSWTPGQDAPCLDENGEQILNEMSEQRGDEFYSHAAANTGLALTHYFTSHLDWAIERQTARDRVDELADIYPMAAKAHALRKRRLTQKEIAEQMGVSVSTVCRLLQKAERYVGRGTMSGDDFGPEQREHLFADLEPEKFQVWVMTAYSWPQARIADVLGISERTVRRYLDDARRFIGGEPNKVRLRRYRGRSVTAAA